MGNCHAFPVRDAYGNWLEEGDWVECTDKKGETTNAMTYGRVKWVHNGYVTFEWSFGNYTYDERMIREWGIRKVYADKDGRKLKQDQIVETRDGREGIVASIGHRGVNIQMTSTRDWLGGSLGGSLHGSGHYSQHELESSGVVICGSFGRSSRKCSAGACF